MRQWRTSRDKLSWFMLVLTFFVVSTIVFIKFGNARGQDVENFAEVMINDLQRIRRDGLPGPPDTHDGGCCQCLARADYLEGPKKLWASRDFRNGNGHYRNLDLCDGPSKWAGRGHYIIEFTDGRRSPVIRMRLEPTIMAAWIDHYSYYWDQVHTWEDPDSLLEVYGAYAKAFVTTDRHSMGDFPSDYELQQIADAPPLDYFGGPYGDAYDSLVESAELLGVSISNPYTPATPESNRHAWDMRQAIFAYMADGPVNNPHPRIELYHNMVVLCEWVILVAAHEPHDYDFNRQLLIGSGWPTSYTYWIDRALDYIYEQTIGIPENDPFNVFKDVDVSTEDSSWGWIKGTFR